MQKNLFRLVRSHPRIAKFAMLFREKLNAKGQGEHKALKMPTCVAIGQAKMCYQTVNGGVCVNARYSAANDISYYLRKHGANGLFDFYSIGLVSAVDGTFAKHIVKTSGDWHAPYVVKAVNNADGQMIDSDYFTGGNHGYDNTATGVPTARTDNLKVYADGIEVSANEAGNCDELRIEWDNYIQGYNTTRADGTGREIMREHIAMTFDGYKWESETTIYPLEDIVIKKWYGLQLFTSNYNQVAYINGDDRLIAEKSENSESGSATTNAMEWSNLEDTVTVEIDTTYDLGNRKYASSTAKAFFARSSYNKAYGTIIDGSAKLSSDSTHSIRGSYVFRHECITRVI